jgi:hypothetical protein
MVSLSSGSTMVLPLLPCSLNTGLLQSRGMDYLSIKKRSPEPPECEHPALTNMKRLHLSPFSGSHCGLPESDSQLTNQDQPTTSIRIHSTHFHQHPICKGQRWGLGIRFRIRIRMFLGLPDPHPDSLVTSTDPDPDPFNIKQK